MVGPIGFSSYLRVFILFLRILYGVKWIALPKVSSLQWEVWRINNSIEI